MVEDGVERPLPSKGYFTIPPGSVVSMRAGGGGGVGDPLSRSEAAVMADLAAGYVSSEAAQRIYGVDPATGRRAGTAAA
jgi:N-methylhydantoinase B